MVGMITLAIVTESKVEASTELACCRIWMQPRSTVVS